MSDAKKQTIFKTLVDNLEKRFPTFTVTKTVSATDPVVTISEDATPATAERVIVIRVSEQAKPDGRTDIFGVTRGYVPHQIEICTEANPSAGAGADNLLPQDLLHVFGECFAVGAKVVWYNSAVGDVPAVGEMTSSNLVAEYEDLYWNKKATA